MKPSFSFTNEKILTIPKTGFVNNFRLLKTIQAVLVRKERFDAASLLKTFFKGAFSSLNFIRLLRVVITPLVTVVERRKRLEAIGWISGYPFPNLTQRGRLFLFLKSRFCKWSALIGQHFCQAFLPKIKISCGRLIWRCFSSHGCTVRLLSLTKYSESLWYIHMKRSKLKLVREICWIIEDLVVSYISQVEIAGSSYL